MRAAPAGALTEPYASPPPPPCPSLLPLLSLPVDAVVCRLSRSQACSASAESAQNENRAVVVVWLSDRTRRTRRERGEPIGVPHEQSAPSGDSAVASVISQDLIAPPDLLRSLFPWL